jgi:hypothetical protein
MAKQFQFKLVLLGEHSHLGPGLLTEIAVFQESPLLANPGTTAHVLAMKQYS